MLEKPLPAMKHPQILINHYLNKCKYMWWELCRIRPIYPS